MSLVNAHRALKSVQSADLRTAEQTFFKSRSLATIDPEALANWYLEQQRKDVVQITYQPDATALEASQP